MSFGKGTLADALMAPTTIYVQPVLKLLDAGIKVRGMSHITGGGITGNLPRAFAKGIAAVVDTPGWKRQAICDWLPGTGGGDEEARWRVFNSGGGSVLLVTSLPHAAANARLKQSGPKP